MSAIPLRVRGLTKSFPGHPVFRDLDLVVEPGRLVALRGHNGAGKSTVIGCVAGTVIADAGTIEIAGHDLRTAPLVARRALRYLPQEIEIPLGLTGREVIDFHAEVFGDPAGVARAESLSGLGVRLAHLASTYSVGMRWRLAFSALAPGEPRLLVLDEPFAGIDHEARERLRDWLRASLESGCGVLVAAHAQDIDALASVPVRELDLSR